jgi:CRISPR-associated protein Cas5d
MAKNLPIDGFPFGGKQDVPKPPSEKHYSQLVMPVIRLKVWGPRALFTRPEMKAERLSYDIMTPSAARGVVEAIHWKPEIRWQIERIWVLNQIKFESIRRNEVGSKIPAGKVRAAMRSGSTEGLGLRVDEDRQQRAATLLRDVAYVIEASVHLTDRGRANPSQSVGKHLDMAHRRAGNGQCFHRPYMGTREFACDFELLNGDPPPPHESLGGTRDLGWMLLDAHGPGMIPCFFRATMTDGMIRVPGLGDKGVAA